VEIGKKIKYDEIIDRKIAINRFCKAMDILNDIAGDEITLYIENNVLSHTNANTFSGNNPFLLTCYDEYQELHQQMEFKLLLDVAHLKVSCNSLGLKLNDELDRLLPVTDYIHFSDNDGLHDQNIHFSKNNSLFQSLLKRNINNKIITLEVYSGIYKLQDSYNTLCEELNI